MKMQKALQIFADCDQLIIMIKCAAFCTEKSPNKAKVNTISNNRVKSILNDCYSHLLSDCIHFLFWHCE